MGGILALVLAVLAVGAVVLVLRRDGGDGRADEAAAGARRFLDAWAAGDLERAAGLTDGPEAARSLLESVRENMRPERMAFTVSGVPEEAAGGEEEGALTVPFTASFTLDGVGEWSYRSAVPMVPNDEG
ncbi:NTF2-like N-terminal transpeptidase domain-containing protein, partial [Streptomyces sp. SBT349]|uniref:NTF2-like N-terminal transpeptidase domain-containing protein n=1 Tax=Streptomyces sp. SBT349 TaxID=1580539 RepID=UPI00066E466F